MSIIEYTVTEAIEKLGLGRTTIYDWIRRGEIPARQTPRGKIIELSHEKLEEIRKYTGYYKQKVDIPDSEKSENETELCGNFQDGVVRNDELSLEMLRIINELKNDLMKYSEKAGQVKLLEDSESRTREKYFELIQKNAELNAELKEKDKEIIKLREKIIQLESQNWWKFFRK